ncbi:MAG: hypothetical protein JO187_01730 [Acidobacteria bacterium]|nr:hypothetical protein [Acidobacteriota bacterium]
MTSNAREPIWFNPPKFWDATRNMSCEEADRLMDEVFRLAEAGKLEELSNYDFIGTAFVPLPPHRLTILIGRYVR